MNHMTRGYLDGLEPDAMPPGDNRSASYRHGWMNGRDDMSGRPRAAAETLRRKADEAEAIDRLAGINPDEDIE